MADLKISQLGPFTETDVVAADVLALADTSAQQTKKIAASDLVKAGARLNADTITFGNDVVVTGDLTVNGTTTTINTQDLLVEDKNVIIGNVTTPSDVTADGGGITLKGTTDKTINWVDATDAWTLSEHVDLGSGKEYRINGTKVLDATSLGSAVVSSSLTSVGTIGTGVWNGTTIGTGYGGTGQTTYTDGQLLIGKTDGTLAKATITQGSGVIITNGDGTITIAATGSGGTVTSVDVSGGTGLTSSGGPITSSGTITVDLDNTAVTPGSYTYASITVDQQGRLTAASNGTTPLTSSDIGVTVQGYDADTAKLDTAQTFTSAQTFAADLTLNAQSDLRFADSDSSNWVALQAPATVASNVTWTLPNADGTSGQVLSTDGAGALSWATAATDKIEEGNSSVEVIDTGSDGRVVFTTEGNEVGRFDSSGRLGVGSTAPARQFTVYNSSTPIIQLVNSTTGQTANDGVMLYESGSNFVIENQEAGEIRIYNNGSQRATIDSSGRLLVGTSTSVDTNCLVQSINTGESSVALGRNDATVSAGNIIGGLTFYGNSDSVYDDIGYVRCVADGSHTTSGTISKPTRLEFSTCGDGQSSPTERMRITNDGTIYWGTTSASVASGGIVAYPSGVSQFAMGHASGTASGTAYVGFQLAGTQIGSITQNGTSAVAYNTSSDYRLKENVTAVTDGITRLQQLKPSRFNFIADPNTTVDGFLAHEVQTVVPEAITGEKDAVDADGNPEYQGIDQSKLVPLLTAALQEAIGEIESLKARVAALESV